MNFNLDGLLSTLWRASWQGAVVFVAVGLICRILSRRLSADTQCWLWRLSYIKILASLLWGGAILLPILPTIAHPAVVAAPVVQASQAPAPSSPASDAGQPKNSGALQTIPLFNLRIALSAFYLLGVLFCIFRLLFIAARTRRIAQSATQYEVCTEDFAELSRAIGLAKAPQIAMSNAVQSPVLVANTVLLPREAEYDTQGLRLILAHELAHARRRDLMWEWLGIFVQITFFFHPLVVLARREERLARESAADAFAIHATGVRAADYGKLLLSIALQQRNAFPALAGVVGAIDGGTPLRRRLLALRFVMTGGESRPQSWRTLLVLIPTMLPIMIPFLVVRVSEKVQAASTDSLRFGDEEIVPPSFPSGENLFAGTVRDDSGRPVSGIWVGLERHWTISNQQGRQTGSRWVKHVLTDSAGRFSFTNLPAGRYSYRVFAQTAVGQLPEYVPIRAPLTITPEATHGNVNVVVSTGSLLSGRVVDGITGQPAAGVLVGAGSAAVGSNPVGWGFVPITSVGFTDARGVYLVRVMPGHVFVSLGRVMTGSLASQRPMSTAQSVMIGAGGTAAAPDLQMFLFPAIFCEGADGEPDPNAEFRYSSTAFQHGSGVTAYMHQNGAVVLDHAQCGSFVLSQSGISSVSGTYSWSPGHPLVIRTGGQVRSYPDGIGIVRL